MVEAFGNIEHGVDPAQGDDVGLEVRIDGREDGVDLARVLLVHGHGHLESVPPPAKAVHHLEAAHVGAHEQGTAALVY